MPHGLASRALLALLFIGVPAAGVAGDAPANIIVDFNEGAPLALYTSIRTIAFGLFVFALLFALFLEFLKPPADGGPQFLKVGIRAFAILVVLVLYPTLAGTVVKSLNGLAVKVSPSQAAVLEYFQKRIVAENQAIRNPSGLRSVPRGAAGAGAGGATQYGSGGAVPANAPPKPPGACPAGFSWQVVTEAGKVGWSCEADFVDEDGWMAKGRRLLFEAILTLLFAVLGAAKYVVEQLGAILTAVFYLVGPLALVASIPKVSNTGGNWFRQFVVYASWPVFTGLVMNLVVYVSLKTTSADTGYIDALWTAIAVALSMTSVPVLAGQIVGAAGGSFMSAATGAAIGYATKGAGSVGSAMSSKGAAAAQAAVATATGGAMAAAFVANPAIAAALKGLGGAAGGGGAGPVPSNNPGQGQ